PLHASSSFTSMDFVVISISTFAIGNSFLTIHLLQFRVLLLRDLLAYRVGRLGRQCRRHGLGLPVVPVVHHPLPRDLRYPTACSRFATVSSISLRVTRSLTMAV